VSASTATSGGSSAIPRPCVSGETAASANSPSTRAVVGPRLSVAIESAMNAVHTVTSRMSGFTIAPMKLSSGCSATTPVASTRAHVSRVSSLIATHVSPTVTSSSRTLASRVSSCRPSSDVSGLSR
jgi:hypothetical protein